MRPRKGVPVYVTIREVRSHHATPTVIVDLLADDSEHVIHPARLRPDTATSLQAIIADLQAAGMTRDLLEAILFEWPD